MHIFKCKLGDIITFQWSTEENKILGLCGSGNPGRFSFPDDAKAYFTIITPINKLIERKGEVHKYQVTCPVEIDCFGV